MGRSILITGAAGFIGFHAALALVKQGDSVIGVDDFNDYYDPALKRLRQKKLQEKGVEIMMHHETSAAPRTYEQQMDKAYALMQRLEIGAVKTGYVGPLIPEGE